MQKELLKKKHEHDKKLAKELIDHQTTLSRKETDHELKLSKRVNEINDKISKSLEDHERSLEESKKQHDEKLQAEMETHAQVLEEFSSEHAEKIENVRNEHEEKLIKEMFFNTNLKYIINRFGVIAGPWQFGKQDQGFVSLWIARHILKKNLKYIGFGGTGHQIRDVLHINDVCDLILLQIRRLKIIYNDTFNVGGGLKNKISLKDLTFKCQFLIKRKIKIKKITKAKNSKVCLLISCKELKVAADLTTFFCPKEKFCLT